MDEEVLKIINNLTNGKYAEEYFTNRGLTTQDIDKIRELLINSINNLESDKYTIEMQLYEIINRFCYDNKLSENSENTLTNTFDEKLMIYKLNTNNHNNICTCCKKELIKDFKYCPYCGNENIQITLKIVVEGNIDLNKGYITPEEAKHIRFLTPAEEKALKEGTVQFMDVGIALDETNTPYEIKNLLISKNESLRNNPEEREKLFKQNMDIHKKQVLNYKLSVFEDSDKIRSLKIYPLSVIQNKTEPTRQAVTEEDIPLVKPPKGKKKYIKIITRPSISKTKEIMKENEKYSSDEEYLRNVEDLKINLKYAGVLYLLDALKYPKNPDIANNMMYWLNISSKSEVIEYLRKKNYINSAKGMDLIKANLKELKEKDLNDIIKLHNLKAGKNKDDTIRIICESLERKELEQYNTGNAVVITKKGYQFIDDNPQVEIYSKYLYNFNFKSFEQFYIEHEHESLTDIALDFLNNMRDYFTEKMKWNRYSLTFKSESMIYSDTRDRLMQLKSYINYFISVINPWDDNKLSHPNLSGIDVEELIKITDKSKLSFKQIEELFITQIENIKLPYLFLSADETFDYFMRIYNREDMRIINKKLSEKIELDKIDSDSLEFFYKKEQEELINDIKKIIG